MRMTRRSFVKAAAAMGAGATVLTVAARNAGAVTGPAFAKVAPSEAAESAATATLDYSGDAEVPIPIAPKTYPVLLCRLKLELRHCTSSYGVSVSTTSSCPQATNGLLCGTPF